MTFFEQIILHKVMQYYKEGYRPVRTGLVAISVGKDERTIWQALDSLRAQGRIVHVGPARGRGAGWEPVRWTPVRRVVRGVEFVQWAMF